MSSQQRIGVVGAGVVGLSTAVQIQSALPSSQVTIIADRFNQDTTSDGAAGIFQPCGEIVPGVNLDLLRQWTKDSFAFYHELASSPEAANAGVAALSAFHFFIDSEADKDPVFKEVVYDYRQCTEAELKIFPNTDKAHTAFRFTTLIIEGRWFLPWLMKRFEANGGLVEKRKLNSLEELVGRFDIVVNCTGIGSCELLGDEKMVPNRGQVIRVKAPWVKHAVIVDKDVYIIPGRDTVVVGGTRQHGDADLNVRVSDRNQIWETACKYVPSLKTQSGNGNGLVFVHFESHCVWKGKSSTSNADLSRSSTITDTVEKALGWPGEQENMHVGWSVSSSRRRLPRSRSYEEPLSSESKNKWNKTHRFKDDTNP